MYSVNSMWNMWDKFQSSLGRKVQHFSVDPNTTSGFWTPNFAELRLSTSHREPNQNQPPFTSKNSAMTNGEFRSTLLRYELSFCLIREHLGFRVNYLCLLRFPYDKFWIEKIVLGFLFYECLFMCKARWSDREKHRSQWTHLKGFAPVCLR